MHNIFYFSHTVIYAFRERKYKARIEKGGHKIEVFFFVELSAEMDVFVTEGIDS